MDHKFDIRYKWIFWKAAWIGVLCCEYGLAQSLNNCSEIDYVTQKSVPSRLLPAMDRIATAYCELQGKESLIVTSGVRSPEHQARLMQTCLSGSACGYYANNDAANELQNTYNAARVGNKLNAVVQKIIEQVNRVEPCFISKHLTEYALDLERRKNGSSAADCQSDLQGDDLILSNVLNASSDIYNITYKEAGGCTHFHVNFIGWEKIEGLKYCSSKD